MFPACLADDLNTAQLKEIIARETLAPSLDLLSTAGIIHPVFNTAAHGVPLEAEVDSQYFKVIFIDVALAQTILGSKINEWFLNPLEELINKGSIVEAFVGQELLRQPS